MIRDLILFAQGQTETLKNCVPGDTSTNCLSRLPEVAANEKQLQNGLAIVFGVLAAIAVIVIILGAISFITSEGNPENISKSKKTVIYALIGLVIALSAEAIVLTVVGKL